MPTDITVPDLGDFKEVEVIDVLVKAGDKIDVDTPLITLETEKATIDVPSTATGVLKSVALKKGDRVSKGSVIGQIESEKEAIGGSPSAEAKKEADGESRLAQNKKEAAGGSHSGTSKKEAAGESAAGESKKEAAGESRPADGKQQRPGGSRSPASEEKTPAAAPSPSSSSSEPSAIRHSPSGSPPHASPSVRKFARELGVDLSGVQGSGIKGRITHDDVKAWVKQTLKTGVPAAGGGLPKVAEVDFAKFGPVEVKPLGRIQKISGPRLQASWLNVPHVWQMDEADITELEEARNRLKGDAAKAGVKLTPLAFILRACVQALREFPLVNSSLDASGQNLVLKQYIHLGFAADTPNGLVVPVIRDAEKKDVYELARELAALSERARAGKLSAAQMQGASFTVSSLGGIGGTSFTPIINAPEVAILGVARASMKPLYQHGQFVPRLILPFTFAYDHRVIDGAAAVRFTTFLAGKLADVKGLLEAVP